MITFNCTKCNARLKVADEKQGKQVKCPQCLAILSVLKQTIEQSPAVPKASSNPDPYAVAEPTKACPFCGETILEVAKKCKHCNERLTPLETTATSKDTARKNKPQKGGPAGHPNGLLRNLSVAQRLAMFIGFLGLCFGLGILLPIFWPTVEKDLKNTFTTATTPEVSSINSASCTPVDLDQVYNDYIDNNARAQATWTDKPVSLTGKVGSITSTYFYIRIPSVGNDGALVTCNLSATGRSKLMSINNGDTVTAYGKVGLFNIISDGTFMFDLDECDFDKK